jgi:DNA-directed RNA polymerase subunit RPC12/RpoP
VQRLAQYCLECGGTLSYDSSLKQYSCRSCGLTFTSQQLLEGRGQLNDRESSDEQKRRRQKEYLNWWLSKK